jgi:hypothetical protein
VEWREGIFILTKDKLIMLRELSDDQTARLLDIEKQRMNAVFNLAYFTVFSGLFVALTLILISKDPELYKEVLRIVSYLAGGSGLGYGIGKQMNTQRR